MIIKSLDDGAQDFIRDAYRVNKLKVYQCQFLAGDSAFKTVYFT